MKAKNLLLCCFIILSFSSLAQNDKSLKSSIGLTFSSFGSGQVFNSANESLIGGPSYDAGDFFNIGVSYIHPIRKWIDIETGIEYSNQTIKVSPMNIPPATSAKPYDKKMSLINIPITARINFLKYFFVNGGFILNFEAGGSSPIDSQSGVGTMLGIGAKYAFDNGLGVFVNGYNKTYAWIPFSADKNDYRWRLEENGVRIGLTYNIK